MLRIWKLAGAHENVRYDNSLYAEYEVFQHDTMLASFEVRTSPQIV